MSFRLFSERAQKKISTAKNGLSLSVFVVGLLITGFLADTFYQSELKHQHENLTSQAREFYKIQNLTLNNNILKIQSFNEILNFKSFSDSKQHIFIKEIISNTIFTRASVFAFRKKYDAENLPELTFKTRVKTANDTLPSTLTSKLKSAYVKRKIKYMLDNKLLSSISISNTDGLSTMAFILRADNNSGNFVIFSTTLENFFKDWPSNQNLSAILSDNQAHLNILIQQDTVTKKFLFSVAPEAISATQNKSKLLVYSSFLSNEAYGISINWYQQAVPTPSHYVMMIGGFGLCISALLALFLRFILGQNRRIYKLVLSRTEELEKAMNEAKEANQAKTRFLTNMSHELRTPLNLILGMVEVLQDSGQTEKNKNHLNSMQSAGEHLLNLITDLLSMAKDEDEDAKLHHISFDLPKFFEDIASIVGPECGKKNLDFVLNISDEIPTILLGDAVKVRQIILNLLRNSLRYTNEGSIELRVELFKKSHPNDQTAHVRFQIKDTGIGIPKDKMNLIFDRFFQINKSLDFSNDGGVGLGLSIVKDLVAKMDGNIIVHSEEGKGSDFIVDLDFDCRDEHAWIESFHHTSGERIKNVLFISKKFESLSKIKALLPSSCFQVEEVSAGIIPEVPPQLKDGKNRYVILDELDEQVLTLLTKEFPEKTILYVGEEPPPFFEKQFNQVAWLQQLPVLPTKIFTALDFSPVKKNSIVELKKLQEDTRTLKTISVLAVDDDAGNRELIKAYLEDTSYSVMFAENGEQALEVFKKESPDVIIADLRMPVMNGFELATAIKQYDTMANKATTPFILLTADALEETNAESKNYPISTYLTKPVRKQKLLEVIRHLKT